MFKKLKIPSYLKFLSGIILVLVAIGFTSKPLDSQVCENVHIKVEGQLNNYFLDENDVMLLLTKGMPNGIVGTPMAFLDLRELESRLKASPYIADGQVYKDLKGNISVQVRLRSAEARFLNPSGEDYYLTTEGGYMPVSAKYTSRVLLISGDFSGLGKEKMTETDFGKQLDDLINFIEGDRFWKAQIAQVDIDKNGELTMYPQVSKQVIEFGSIEGYQKKFEKLKIFYKQILPQKGWNSYSRVNVKYHDQIVCE